MHSAAKSTRGVFQETGEVVEPLDGALQVETESGRFAAVRAVSCLIEPEPGDRVLLAVPPSGDLFVLAVLTRESDKQLELPLSADASIRCKGTLSLFASDELELRAAKRVSTVSNEVTTTAVEASLNTDKLFLVGRFVEAHTEQVKGFLGVVDTVLDRISQKVKRSYKYVEEIDMTRAAQIDLHAEGTLGVKSKNAFVTSENLVKIQGEQMHLG